MDIRKLEFENESVDLILANDVLEHFSHREVDNLLKEWSRVLKPNGQLLIRCPSLELQVKAYMEGKWDADIASYMIFGGQTNQGDYHCVAFDKESISKHLTKAGFEIIEFNEEDIPQDRGFINLNMNVKAVKMKININDNSEQSSGLFTGFNFDDEEKQEIEKTTKSKAELNIVWEGSQFVYHSLALINREHCSNIIDTELAELTIVPFDEDKFSPEGNPKYEKLLNHDIRVKQNNPETENLPYVWIRHQWPPKSDEPKGAKWIIMQPWEYSRIWKSTAEIFKRADEIWTPSNYSRQSFINSGIDFNKVQIIPNGINPDLFKPNGETYQLPTSKKFKFLFVGGSIWRKGIDLLLEAYKSVFKPEDDICLVIKDLGTDSFYKGMDAQQKIQEFADNPAYPEVIYINEELSEEEMAGLYRACDVLVNPYRGEGFSLPTLEAMACGLPVVVTQGGATDDYCDEEVAWLIPSKEKSIGKEIDGEELTDEATVLEPDLEILIQVLRIIFDRPNEILTAGILASHRARTNWTWKKATIKIFSRLDYLYGKNLAKQAEKILIDNDDASIILGEAELNYINQNYDDAEKLYKQAVETGDLNEKWGIYSLYHIALININKSNFAEAEKYLEKTKNSQYQVDNLYLQAKIHYAKEEWTETLEILADIMNNWAEWKYQTTIGLSLDLILCDNGNVFLNLKDIENALNIFKQALKINEQNGLACLGAAKCFIEIDAIEDAKKMLDWAIRLDPTLTEARELRNSEF